MSLSPIFREQITIKEAKTRVSISNSILISIRCKIVVELYHRDGVYQNHYLRRRSKDDKWA